MIAVHDDAVVEAVSPQQFVHVFFESGYEVFLVIRISHDVLSHEEEMGRHGPPKTIPDHPARVRRRRMLRLHRCEGEGTDCEIVCNECGRVVGVINTGILRDLVSMIPDVA